jgi:hypothetical protein
MEPAMTKSLTKSKTIAAALAALTLATALAATSGDAQARPRFGTALGIGIAAGALIGIAAASAGPGYVVEPGYAECRYVERYNRWGHLRVVKVCDVAPY